MGDFLKKLQTADETYKKRILVVVSTVVMIIVIYIWLIYFNNLVARETRETVPVAATQDENPGFWGTMQRGSAVLYHNIVGGIEWLGQAFRAPREYIVKPLK